MSKTTSQNIKYINDRFGSLNSALNETAACIIVLNRAYFVPKNIKKPSCCSFSILT